MHMNIGSLPECHCVADHLNLGTLSDGEPGMDPYLLRELYRHARNDDGRRRLFENNKTFQRGWVDLNAPEAVKLISVFVPLDDPSQANFARQLAAANLEAQPWNDALGIEEPPIKCVIKIHGSKWGLRFQSAEPALKGREVINEELPPIPGDDAKNTPPVPPSVPAPAIARMSGSARPTRTDFGPTTIAAAEVLQKAGLPS